MRKAKTSGKAADTEQEGLGLGLITVAWVAASRLDSSTAIALHGQWQ